MVTKITNIRTLVFGAHALDAELMSGGFLSRFEEEIEAKIVHLTRGERGHPVKGKEEFARQLETEIEKAAVQLGAESHWPGFSAGDLPITTSAVKSVEEIIRQFKPHIIITHWQGSWHPRHVNAHLLVKRALQRIWIGEKNKRQEREESKLPLQRLLYGYNCEDLSDFSPDLFVGIEEQHKQRWFAALEEYELFRLSQETSDKVISYSSHYEDQIKIYGHYCGSQYAQVFKEETKLLTDITENEVRPLTFG